MSEVLLVLPLALLCNNEDSENLSAFSFSATHSLNSKGGLSGNDIVASADDSLSRRTDPHPQTLDAEEAYQRMLLMLECQLEFMTLAQWRLAVEAHLKKEVLQGWMRTVTLQEVLLQHHVTRLAHVGKSFRCPVGNPTHCRCMQDEFFECEYVALQEAVEFLDVWSKLIPARLSMMQTPTFLAEAMSNSRDEGHATFTFAPKLLTTASQDKQMKALRKTVRRLWGDLAAVHDEAEVLSFTLEEEVKGGEADGAQSARNTSGSCEENGSEHASYAVNVMRLATRQVDELRGRVFALTKRLHEAEQSLESTQRVLLDEKERSAHLQQLLNTTEEAAVAAYSQCQLHLSRVDVPLQQDDAEKEPDNTPGTYTVRVLEELQRYALTLTKEIVWQKERTQRELRDRDAVLEIVYPQVERLVSLMPRSLPLLELKTEGVNMMNITSMLEGIIMGVTGLKTYHDEGHARGVQLFQPISQPSEAATLQSTIEHMRSTIELLLCEKGKKGDAHLCVGSTVPAVSVANGRMDVLTTVLRRLEEVRGEKIMLELELEEKQRRPLLHGSQKPRHGPTTADDADGGTGSGDNTWVQSVHRLSEANTLLQDELKLEREAGLSLKARLTDSERFIRELQKQCRRLRQSGRFDAYEIIEQSGCDSDDDDAKASDGGSGDDGTPIPLMEARQMGEEKAVRGMCPDEALYAAPCLRYHSMPSTASIDTSFSLRPLTGPSGPCTSICQGEQIACVRDQRRLMKAVRHVHGIKLSTLFMSKEHHWSSCNPHDIWNIFLACSISLHTFFKSIGFSAKVARHVAVLYPLPPTMTHSLPVRQLLCPLKGRRSSSHARNTGPPVEIFDLREEFKSTRNYLRGCMDVCFSQDGRFMYALASADADVIARMCAPECLNIPAEHQFRFSGSLPKGVSICNKSGNDGIDMINHDVTYAGEADTMPLSMDMLGWCGRGGICAWAMDYMQFDSAAERDRFKKHLRSEYRLVLNLSATEVQNFVGGSVELMGLNSAGKTVARLFMSLTAYEALSPVHRIQLLQWYGGPQGVTLLNVGNIERVMAAPVRRLVVMVQWHGRVPLSKTPPRETLERLGFHHQEQHHLPRKVESS
ncbi:hypothetical protein TraAM80_03145 [Trypanosoma rangeli]|uniref:Uncharacterized protein n=1 Tax=Trypanosoma rangeli TaxID=5698 RepID=A0A422NQQ8_TRYRA|nr:uncharacterized protein TraAM80_03145 [Trypanosoma rangeli]RNF07771.1 hypothetical protein TraAM80_03145 [Trypanosoma rangeli]|eukprot:RNF07771.1 hypothetical protein TraAM80_03145 [Trypanosoma rangeli]